MCRGAYLAARRGLPLVMLIDTSDADPPPGSDRDGLAVAISETFIATLSVAAPIVAIVTDEGDSGGALAIGACDRLLMQDDAVFEVITPEGAASILHRDASRAEEVAPRLRPTASNLRGLGVCDPIVPRPTTFEPATAGTALRAELVATLADLDADPEAPAQVIDAIVEGLGGLEAVVSCAAEASPARSSRATRSCGRRG